MTSIKQAPGYSYNEKNEILNDKTGKVIKSVSGVVRLTVNSKRKSFKVADLIDKSEATKKTEAKGWVKPDSKASKKTESTSKDDSKIKGKKSSKKEDKQSKSIEKASEAKKTTSKDKKKAVAAEYPYNIKKMEEINKAKKAFSEGDAITFIDYKTKNKTKGTVVSHSKFGDGYPAARVSFTKDKKKASKLVSYINLKKA